MAQIVCNGVQIFDAGDVISPPILQQLSSGWYERDEAGVLKQILRESDVVMEIGAGIGYLSALSCLIAKNVRVFCYEAHPGMIETIRGTHALNDVGDRTVVKNVVLSTNVQQSTVPFYTRRDFWSSSLDNPNSDHSGIFEVQVLDANAEMSSVRPTVVICDIEGGEHALIPELNMSSVRTIIIEMHPKSIGRQAVADLITILQVKGLLYDDRYSKKNVLCFSRLDG